MFSFLFLRISLKTPDIAHRRDRYVTQTHDVVSFCEFWTKAREALTEHSLLARFATTLDLVCLAASRTILGGGRWAKTSASPNIHPPKSSPATIDACEFRDRGLAEPAAAFTATHGPQASEARQAAPPEAALPQARRDLSHLLTVSA